MDGRWRRGLASVGLLAVLFAPLLEGWQWWGRRRSRTPMFDPTEQAEFYFTRLAYEGGGYRRRGGWSTDWPDAEYHFMQGVNRLTNINAASGGPVVEPIDEALFDYPWVYAVEVGGWYMDEESAARMREYLLRGGFLIVDDFHGSRQWEDFMVGLQRIFPDRPVTEIPEDHALLHVLYDLDQRIQIPGISPLGRGVTYEQDGYTPHWRGIYDDEQRLMVAINFNMDLGDAWEHADTPYYPEKMTALAYRFGINYVIYAMTH